MGTRLKPCPSFPRFSEACLADDTKVKLIGRVPHVRLSVRGPKTMGDPDFLPRGATNVRVCGFH
jgi:hypothetical protein